jgi:hypothetical protein
MAPTTSRSTTAASTVRCSPTGRVLWLRLEDFRAAADHLLAWRCGARRPLDLGPIGFDAQLGAGIVSWIDPAQTVHVERLSTRRQWRWSFPHHGQLFATAVHTAKTLYVTRPSLPGNGTRSLTIFRASLATLDK